MHKVNAVACSVSNTRHAGSLPFTRALERGGVEGGGVVGTQQMFILGESFTYLM